MNKTAIEWRNPKEGWELDYTWNPVVGCKHKCPYCYAKRMNDRFKWILDWQEPEIFPKRLSQPYKVIKPSTIFCGSVTDLFGEWVQDTWIANIIVVAMENPHHRFMFLTKNPARYGEWEFPDNCWLGATVVSAKDSHIDDMYAVSLHQPNKTFISVEPLLGGGFNKGSFIGFDLVIVGAMTGPGAVVPKQEWIRSIQHDNIFYKNNIQQYLK